MRAADLSVDFEISLTKFILSCSCTKEQQELAVEIYSANIIDAMQETKQIMSY